MKGEVVRARARADERRVAAAVACLQLGMRGARAGQGSIGAGASSGAEHSSAQCGPIEVRTDHPFSAVKSIVLLCAQYFKYEPHPELVASLNFR
jgi:hypothetical protein